MHLLSLNLRVNSNQFLLVDDYASVTMYVGVKNGLIGLGVSPDDIREFKEP